MNQREYKVIQFINLVKVCTREQIQELYYSDVSTRYCNMSLTKLVDNKYIKRKYFNINSNTNSYVYYTGKCVSKRIIKHELLISTCIVQLIKRYSIKEIIKSPNINGVIPDAMIVIRTGSKLLYVLLEVQLSPNDIFTKYLNFYSKFKEISEDKPILYVTTNINLDIKKLRDVKLVMDDLNMNKVKELIRIDKEHN